MRMLLVIIYFISTLALAIDYPSIPSPGENSITEYWKMDNVWWHGRANFKGDIISPTCSLAMESIYQVINMGTLPIRTLQDNMGLGFERSFRLKLRNCELTDEKLKGDIYSKSRIRISFDGLGGSSPDRFALFGLAQGIELQIYNDYGTLVRVNEGMWPLILYGNEQVLNYTLRISRNNQPLKAGNYNTVIRFKIDYF